MKKLTTVLIVPILWMWATIAFGDNGGNLIMDKVHVFEQKLETLRRDLNIPGMSVAVLKKQKVVFARGFGYADVENDMPATENTPYHIASLTKPFSVVLIMQLVEVGKLNLDDAMADILSDVSFASIGAGVGYSSLCEEMKKYNNSTRDYAFLFQNYHGDTERITVRHHLTHTSQGVPGEAYRYNGFLFGLLTQVIAKVSGRGFNELLVERIIGQLEMNSTFPGQSDSQSQRILDARAKPYRVNDEGNLVLSKYPKGVNAAAGIVSTVLDLGRFDAAMDQNLIVSEESKAAMFAPTISNNGQPLPYGVGWYVQHYKGAKLVWHCGWQPKSYSSLILKVPAEEFTLILLANSDGASAPFGIGDGDVLRSPFAVTFIDLFTGMETASQ